MTPTFPGTSIRHHKKNPQIILSFNCDIDIIQTFNLVSPNLGIVDETQLSVQFNEGLFPSSKIILVIQKNCITRQGKPAELEHEITFLKCHKDWVNFAPLVILDFGHKSGFICQFLGQWVKSGCDDFNHYFPVKGCYYSKVTGAERINSLLLICVSYI